MRHRTRQVGMLAVLGLLCTALSAVPAISALAGGATEISLLTSTSVPDSAPVGLTTGPNGSVWFADDHGPVGRPGSVTLPGEAGRRARRAGEGRDPLLA